MATMTAPPPTPTRTPGGAFLITNPTPASCFFPEDFTEEHRAIAKSTADFATNEIVPHSDAIEAKDFAVTRSLIKKAADLGLTAADIPEEYGGLEMDKATSAIIAENISKQGSFSVAFSAHTGIGTLPLVWYGTEAQKAKYLPRIADGSMVGAYALSESSSGSDAVNANTRAVLSEDGTTYTLNGEKMWITNGGFADLYTIFAKCLVPEGPNAGKDAGKERLTAFLVERGTPGFTSGKEEHKLGIRGSSTTPLILSDCKIPASNLLGEVGKGHHIAFNILNVGRYKLGNAAVGGAKGAFLNGLKYSKERKAFGKSICEFGLIQEKLANMATGIFVGEAMCYRTVGMIDQPSPPSTRTTPTEIQKRIEEYAVECSMVKVFTSEMLDMVVDESLQIFAGYGYVEGIPRRARLPRRPHQPHLRGHQRDQSPHHHRLADEVGDVRQTRAHARHQVHHGRGHVRTQRERKSAKARSHAEYDLLAAAKKLTLFVAGSATQKYMQKIADEQEVMGALADMIIAVYTMESAILRAEKIGAKDDLHSYRDGEALRRRRPSRSSRSPRAWSSPPLPKETWRGHSSPFSAASRSTTPPTPSRCAGRSPPHVIKAGKYTL